MNAVQLRIDTNFQHVIKTPMQTAQQCALLKYTTCLTILLVFVIVCAMLLDEFHFGKHSKNGKQLSCQQSDCEWRCDIQSYANMNYPLWSDGILTVAYRIMNAQIWHKKCRWNLLDDSNQHQAQLHFALVSDETFPTHFSASQIEQIYSKAEHVYAQNLDRSKLTDQQSRITTCVPIGLDLHTVSKSAYWGLTKKQHISSILEYASCATTPCSCQTERVKCW